MSSTRILTCQIGLAGVSFAVFIRQPASAMLCAATHTVAYDAPRIHQQHRQPANALTIEAILQAFFTGLEWLAARSFTRDVSTITFTCTHYLPVLLDKEAETRLASANGKSPLITLGLSILSLSSATHSSLLWQDLPHRHGSSDFHRALVTTLENSMASRLGITVFDPICQTALCNQHQQGSTMTRRQFQKLQADRNGTMVSASGLPCRLLELTTGLPPSEARDLWANTGFVTTVPGLLIALLTDRVPAHGTTEASLTGCWNIKAGEWDRDLLLSVSDCFRSHYRKDRRQGSSSTEGNILLPLLDRSQQDGLATHKISTASAEQLGLHAECSVSADCLPSVVASYLSHLPNRDDFGLQLGTHEDWLIVPTSNFVPDVDRVVIANPAHTLGRVADLESDYTQPYLALCKVTGAGEARLAVRNQYTNGNWSAFGRMMNVVSAGGTVGMDNKYFTIHATSRPVTDPPFAFDMLKRFESGARVQEFSDLRANARCLIEGQGATMRAFIGRVVTSDREAAESLESSTTDPGQLPLLKKVAPNVDFAKRRGPSYLSATQFDPYDVTLSPSRILAWKEDADDQDIGVHPSLAECLVNVVGGRWVSGTAQGHQGGGSGYVQQPPQQHPIMTATRGPTDYRLYPYQQHPPYQHPPAQQHYALSPHAKVFYRESQSGPTTAQKKDLVDVSLDQVAERALVGAAFLAFASLRKQHNKDTGRPPLIEFNRFIASLLRAGSEADPSQTDTVASSPSSEVQTGQAGHARSQSKPKTRSRSSSSPIPSQVHQEAVKSIIAGSSASGASSSTSDSPTSPTVSFATSASTVGATHRRRAVSASTVQADEIRRRRSASNLSMQTRPGFLSFSILEEGEEEAFPSSSSNVGSNLRSGSGLGIGSDREGMSTPSSGHTSREPSSPVPGVSESGGSPHLRARAVSMVGPDASPSRRGMGAGASTQTRRSPVSRLSRAFSSASLSSSSAAHSSSSGIMPNSADDDDSPDERQIRAWLQGQLDVPPFLVTDRDGQNQYHVQQPASSVAAPAPASATAPAIKSHFPPSSSMGSSSSAGDFAPGRPGTRTRMRSSSSSNILLTSSSGREFDWSEITAPPSETSIDIPHLAAETSASLSAPAGLSSEARLEIIHTQNTQHEELLGLQTMAKADEDVWLVYGAFCEEYLRLKSWTGGLQGSIGELASQW